MVIGAPSEGDELTSSNEEYGKQKLRDLIELLYAPQLAIGLKLLKGKDHTLVREKILDDGAWVDFCRMGVIAAQSFADISSHQKEPEMATKVTYHILGQEKLAPPQQALPDAPQQKTITGGAGPSSNPTSITDRRLMNISNEQDHSPK